MRLECVIDIKASEGGEEGRIELCFEDILAVVLIIGSNFETRINRPAYAIEILCARLCPLTYGTPVALPGGA